MPINQSVGSSRHVGDLGVLETNTCDSNGNYQTQKSVDGSRRTHNACLDNLDEGLDLQRDSLLNDVPWFDLRVTLEQLVANGNRHANMVVPKRNSEKTPLAAVGPPEPRCSQYSASCAAVGAKTAAPSK